MDRSTREIINPQITSVTLQSHQFITRELQSAQYINDQYSLFISADFIYHLSSPQQLCPISICDLFYSRAKMKFTLLCGNWLQGHLWMLLSPVIIPFQFPKQCYWLCFVQFRLLLRRTLVQSRVLSTTLPSVEVQTQDQTNRSPSAMPVFSPTTIARMTNVSA